MKLFYGNTEEIFLRIINKRKNMKKNKKKLNMIKKIFILLWNASKKYFILTIIITCLVGICVPISINMWKEVVNSIEKIVRSGITTVLIVNLFNCFFNYGIIIFLSIIAQNILGYTQVIYGGYVTKYVSKVLYSSINKLDIEDFDNSILYDEINKSNNEAVSRSMDMLEVFVNIVQKIVTIVGIIYIIQKLSIYIVVLYLILMFPIFYINISLVNKLHDTYNERCESERLTYAIKRIMIQYNCINELHINNIGNILINKIEQICLLNIEKDKNIRKKFAQKGGVVNTLILVIGIFIKIAMIIKAVGKKFGIGDITMYLGAVDSLKDSIQSIILTISTGCEAYLYIESFFNIVKKADKEKKEKKFTEEIKEIEFVNVSFKYPNSEKFVLKNINLKLEKNLTYVIVGINGSGKSTLIKLLAGLYNPTEGKVLYNGKDISNFSKESLHSKISAVFQDYIHYPFDVKTNIGLGNYFATDYDLRVRKCATDVGIEEFINSLPMQYETMLGKQWTNGTELSGGQWQKIAIARALMKNYEIIILDEPVASVDAKTEIDIINQFNDISKNKICLFITHRFSNIRKTNKIVVLDKGKIVEEGKHDQLIIKKGIYYKLYKLQARNYKV